MAGRGYKDNYYCSKCADWIPRGTEVRGKNGRRNCPKCHMGLRTKRHRVHSAKERAKKWRQRISELVS